MTEHILIALAITVVVLGITALVIRRSLNIRERNSGVAQDDGDDGGVPTIRRNWLVGIGGDVEGKTFHVGDRTATIGRGLGNLIQTTDKDASRVHCQFTPVSGGLRLKDSKSRNGTYVNGTRTPMAVLADGDEVRIGSARFVYRAVGDFGVDHGVEKFKATSQLVTDSTVVGGSGSIRNLMIAALDAADGNVDNAARKMGIKPLLFKQMMIENEIDRPGRKNG